MKKWNKKLTLMLVLVLVVGVLGGCGNKKIPEGVSHQFYNDMTSSLKKLEKVRNQPKDNGHAKVLEYADKKDSLSPNESEIIDEISNLYLYTWMYYDGEDAWKADIESQIKIISELMDLDIDIDKIVSLD